MGEAPDTPQGAIRPDYVEVGIRRDMGQTIQRIYEEIGQQRALSRTQIGRLAKQWKETADEEKAKYRMVSWGQLRDFDWKSVTGTEKLPGLPREAIPFVLQVSRGRPMTVLEARFLWKLKEATPDIPPDHASHLLWTLFWDRAPLEERGEEVDNSDLWYYLGSHRWGSPEEDHRYIQGVARLNMPPLHPVPPDRRDPGLADRLRRAYNNLETFIWLDLDPLDPQWQRLWKIRTPSGFQDITGYLTYLPRMPWDLRKARDAQIGAANREGNKARLAYMVQAGIDEIPPGEIMDSP